MGNPRSVAWRRWRPTTRRDGGLEADGEGVERGVGVWREGTKSRRNGIRVSPFLNSYFWSLDSGMDYGRSKNSNFPIGCTRNTLDPTRPIPKSGPLSYAKSLGAVHSFLPPPESRVPAKTLPIFLPSSLFFTPSPPIECTKLSNKSPLEPNSLFP